MPESRSARSARTDERRLQGRRLEAFVRDRWQSRSGIRGLSEQVDVSRATLYSWFNGDSAPDTGQLATLAGALGCSPAELVAVMAGEPPPATAGFPQVDSQLDAIADRAVARYRDQLSWEVDRLVGGRDDASEPPLAGRVIPGVRRVGSDPSSGFLALRPARSPAPESDTSPRLVDLFRDQVVDTCEVDDPIGPVMRRMYERNFSQLPVYDGKRLVGLLTTDTIARWHAARAFAGEAAVGESVVGEILPFAETARNFGVLGPNHTASDALHAFENAARGGRQLDGVIVTSTGGPAGRPTAIATRADIPYLSRGRRA